jgi:hypothetical protein
MPVGGMGHEQGRGRFHRDRDHERHRAHRLDLLACDHVGTKSRPLWPAFSAPRVRSSSRLSGSPLMDGERIALAQLPLENSVTGGSARALTKRPSKKPLQCAKISAAAQSLFPLSCRTRYHAANRTAANIKTPIRTAVISQAMSITRSTGGRVTIALQPSKKNILRTSNK